MTAPGRKWPTLRATLESVEGAGWGDVLVSADTTEPDDVGGCVSIVRHRRTGGKQLGPWPHLLDLLQYVLANDRWDRLLVLQDDVQLATGLRPWLEHWCRYQDHGVGVRSLWLPSWHATETLQERYLSHSCDLVAWWPIRQKDLPRRAYGALATAWTRRSAKLLVDDPPRKSGMAKADLRLGQWCKAAGLDWLYPTRSLCQHVGQQNSTLREDEPYGGYRVALNPLLSCPEFTNGDA